MRIWWSSEHRKLHLSVEMSAGRLVRHVEVPDRADRVLEAVVANDLGPVREVTIDERSLRTAAERVHHPGMLDFLSTAWRRWSTEGRDWDALPIVWPVPALRFGGPGATRLPANVHGQLAH